MGMRPAPGGPGVGPVGQCASGRAEWQSGGRVRERVAAGSRRAAATFDLQPLKVKKETLFQISTFSRLRVEDRSSLQPLTLGR